MFRAHSTTRNVTARYFSDNAGSAYSSIAGHLVSAVAVGAFAASIVKLAQRRRRSRTRTAVIARRVSSLATSTASALAGALGAARLRSQELAHSRSVAALGKAAAGLMAPLAPKSNRRSRWIPAIRF